MNDIVKRLLSYVAFDTQADPDSSTSPGTQKQLDLATQLVKDLKSWN